MTDEFEKFDKGLSPIKYSMNEYLKSQIFKKKKYEATYSGTRVLAGIHRKSKKPYYLDIREGLRILVLGSTGCLPKNTLIKTNNGNQKIQDVNKVLTYNFKKKTIEEKDCNVINSGQKQVYKIHTSKGIIKCSSDHRWFVLRNKKIKKIMTKNLKRIDFLIKTNEQFLQIKKIEKTEEFIEMYDLQVKDNHNFILKNNIITHNSGKTFLMRGLCDRIEKADKSCFCFLTDPKSEWRSSVRPVQEHFRHLLMKGEKPAGMPVYTFRPIFFKEFDTNGIPEECDYCSLNIKDLEAADFFTALNADELSTPQKISLEIAFEEVKKGGREITSVDDLKAIIDEIPEITNQQKNSIKYKLRPLEKMNLFDVEYSVNPVAVIQKGFYPALNLQNFEEFTEQVGMYPHIFVSIWLKGLIRARRAKIIPPIWVVLDELARFCPADENQNPSSKHAIIQSIELDRRSNVKYLLGTQSISSVPERVLKNCRYLFLPYNTDLETLKSVLKLMGMIGDFYGPTQQRDLSELKGQMKQHDFIIFDRELSEYHVIIVPGPLSWHLETEN